MNDNILFCYGTLRRGLGNHGRILGGEFLGEARTKNPYALFCEGIPFCVQDIPFRPVIGEIFIINDETLKKVDSLEGHPISYCRQKVPLITKSNQEIEGWVYFYPDPLGDLIVNGDFTSPEKLKIDVKKEFPIRYEFSLTEKDPWRFENEIVSMSDRQFVNSYWHSNFAGSRYSSAHDFMRAMSEGSGTEYHEGIRFDSPENWVEDLVKRGFLTKFITPVPSYNLFE